MLIKTTTKMKELCFEDIGELRMSRLFISMYHYTRDLKHSRYPGIKGLDIDLFRRQMDFFNENFNVVRMEQVIDIVKNGGVFPERSVLLTFDDGYIDHFTYAFPILEKYGFQGSFFIPGKTFTTRRLLDVNKIHYILANANVNKLVKDLLERMDYYRGREFHFPTNNELWAVYAQASRLDIKEVIFIKQMLQSVLPGNVRNRILGDLFEKYVGVSEEQLACELYMTEDQIRMLRQHGMFIGVHGFDHCWMGNMSTDEMKMDIMKALDVMDPFMDAKEWVMNYPYGSFNQDVLNFIEKKGACIGLTTDVRVADLCKDNALTLPRLDCNDFPPKSKKYLDILNMR